MEGVGFPLALAVGAWSGRLERVTGGDGENSDMSEAFGSDLEAAEQVRILCPRR